MKLYPLLLAATLSLSAVTAQAYPSGDTVDEAPSAGAMAFDLILVRPLSLFATVIGTGLFVLDLPLSLVMGEAPSVPAQVLVVEPARYTFRRPLGQIN